MSKHIRKEEGQGTIFLITATVITVAVMFLAVYITVYDELPTKTTAVIGLLVAGYLGIFVACSIPRTKETIMHAPFTREIAVEKVPEEEFSITDVPPSPAVTPVVVPLRDTPVERAWKKYNRTYHRLLVYLAIPPTGYTVILPWYVIPTLKEFDREGQQIRAMCNELGPTHEGRMEELYTLLCRTAIVYA